MHTLTYTALLHPTSPDGGAYLAEVRAMPGCFAHGDTIEEATAMITEAVVGYLNLCIAYGEPVPTDVAPPRFTEAEVVKVSAQLDPASGRWESVPYEPEIAA